LTAGFGFGPGSIQEIAMIKISTRMGVLMGLFATAMFFAAGSSLAAAEGAGITVEGNKLMKDGQLWVPKGFTLVGFVAPEKYLGAGFKEARNLYGPQELDRARSFGADVLRFQMSQAGLDPQSSIFDPRYMGEIVEAVHQAREKGFSVIVSMQWEPPSGLKGQPMMPSDITRRAWSRIVSAFGNDRYIMLEVFNEPGMYEETPKSWEIWQSGMQSLIDIVRRGGAQNTLLLDGLRGGHYLKDAPPIRDPLNKIVYAIHPYIDERDHGPEHWTTHFGYFARNHAVLTTEWNATSTLQCRPDDPEVSRQFIDYLKERNIGLILWALDLRGSLFDANWNPMGFKDFQCGKWGTGAANIAIEYFRSK
jgi:Cellulase (glycosyl hydrolase family 5)